MEAIARCIGLMIPHNEHGEITHKIIAIKNYCRFNSVFRIFECWNPKVHLLYHLFRKMGIYTKPLVTFNFQFKLYHFPVNDSVAKLAKFMKNRLSNIWTHSCPVTMACIHSDGDLRDEMRFLAQFIHSIKNIILAILLLKWKISWKRRQTIALCVEWIEIERCP